MRVELNIVLKKELLVNTETYEPVDEITVDFDTLFDSSAIIKLKHYEDSDLPMFCYSSLLLRNAFENIRIESILCKDLINNEMTSNNDNVTFIARKNVSIINGYVIDFILKASDNYRCTAATQGFIFSHYFAKTMGAIIKIENNNIASIDTVTLSRYLNSDIEDAASNGYKYNYDGLIYYDHYLPYNNPLKDLGLKSFKGECSTTCKRVEKEGDYRVYFFIYNRRDMVKSLFRR